MLGMGLRGLGLEGPLPAWIEKLGKGMLLLAVAPIVLVLIVGVVVKSLFEAFVEYRRTGTWPSDPAGDMAPICSPQTGRSRPDRCRSVAWTNCRRVRRRSSKRSPRESSVPARHGTLPI